jgi:hypothetical protein
MFTLTALHSTHVLHNGAGGTVWPLIFVTNYSVTGPLAAAVLVGEFVLGAVVVAVVARQRQTRRAMPDGR